VTTESAHKIENAYKKVFEAMLDGGINAIIKIANEIFNSPVVFTDDNYRIISQFPHHPIGDPIWDTLIENKILSLETVWEYRTLLSNEKADKFRPFYANWGLATNVPRIMGTLYKDDRIFGHLEILLGTRPFCEDDIELAQLVLNALNIEIRNKLKNNLWRPSPSVYLQDMLKKDASYQVKNHAEISLHKHISGDYTLLVTPIGTHAAKKSFAASAVTELSIKYHNIISTIYEDSIVILLGEVDSSDFQPKDNPYIKQILNFLKDHNLVSGISNCFNNLYDIPIYYKQALLTAKIAIKKNDTTLGSYNDYAPMHMFLTLSEEEDPEAYIHPSLEQIRSYDQTHNTEYFNTLRVYSMTMHNKDSTATRLCIHRNTLLYRLNRIRDLFDVCYENERTSIHLLTSFLLLEALD
jgi:PucR C-terminal helix-turn-helix domain/GGDEF-like domain